MGDGWWIVMGGGREMGNLKKFLCVLIYTAHTYIHTHAHTHAHTHTHTHTHAIIKLFR